MRSPPRPFCARPWALGKLLAHLVRERPNARRRGRSPACQLDTVADHSNLVWFGPVGHSMCATAWHRAAFQDLQRCLVMC